MNYNIEEKYKVNGSGLSKGCQIKYFRNKYWYKIDSSCNEGLNEHVVSLILKCSNYRNFVYYERCTVNGRKACRSYTFINEDEEFIDLDTIIKRAFYALPEMSNKEGLKTNAIYGFTNMLLKIIET